MRTKAAVVIALGVLVTFLASSARDTPAEPTRPTGWRPFSAEFRVTGQDGRLIQRGRYWRASDGSDRRETESGDLKRSGIQIRNIAENTCYRFKVSKGWTAQPMRLPAEGWLPPMRGARGASAVLFAGLDGLRASAPHGDYMVQIPSLDFFRALRFTAASGRREEYVNLVLGEPAHDLFLPPVGTSLTRLTEPAGIIAGRSVAAPVGSDTDDRH